MEKQTNIRPNVARRRTALVLLGVAVAMLVAGLLLGQRLSGVGFLAYWLMCFAFLLGAMISAVRDMRDIRRQSREQQIGLIEEAFDEVAAEVKDARDKQRASRRK